MADGSLDLSLTAVQKEFNTGDVSVFVGDEEGDRFGDLIRFPFGLGEDALIGMFWPYRSPRYCHVFPTRECACRAIQAEQCNAHHLA